MAFPMLFIHEFNVKVIIFHCETVVFYFEKYWMLSVKCAECKNLNMSKKVKLNSKLYI